MERVVVFFETSDSHLTLASIAAINAALGKVPKRKWVLVSGYADSRGDDEANRLLSDRRAKSVQAELIAGGVDRDVIKTFAFGEKNPATTNDTAEGRAKNRRVEVQIIGEGEIFPGITPSLGDMGPVEEGSAGPQERQQAIPLQPGNTSVAADTPWVENNVLAPARLGNDVLAFVDGRDYMADAADAIDRATSFIYITDWALIPAIRLRRPGTVTLLDQLRAAAKRGVRVRVLLYESFKRAVDNLDREAERDLEAAHANIRASRHLFFFKWSHHQKTMIMDDGSSTESAVAYVGGIDFTIGRWDKPDHVLSASTAEFQDHTGTSVGGTPYYDGEFYNPDVNQEALFGGGAAPLRARFSRMPWHDIHLRIKGPSVFDVENNFVQRWNFQARGAGETALAMSRTAPAAAAGDMIVQITRSASNAAIGITGTEDGILRSYLRAIQHAQHHVYIEQQFFTSNFGAGPVNNAIMSTLADRIIRAVQANERFRVKIVIPVHPEGDIDKWSTQELMHWQYRTLVREAGIRRLPNQVALNSLVGRVLAAVGGNRARLEQFLGIYNLRNFGTFGATTLTEQIYVHAKLMIVDDRVVIVGSANINDRSMLGTRDTELNATVVDRAAKQIDVDGNKTLVRAFAHDLRVKLWAEHLGLSSTSQIVDPVADVGHKLWNDTATKNTAAYEAVFPNIPSDNHEDLAAQRAAAAFVPANAGRLSQIKGHLTLFPLDWLRNEDLETAGQPDDIFTFLHILNKRSAVA